MNSTPQSEELDERVVLITGAAKRIGRALTLNLAEAGWRVALHYNTSDEEAHRLVKEVEASGGIAVCVSGDLVREDAPEELLGQCRDRLGAPLCLINNASIFENDSLQTLTSDSWNEHININLRAPVLLSQLFAENLPEGKNGNIINIIDQKVLRLTPYFFSYTIAKSGLWTATQTMAQALAPRIRVNAIGPGPILQSIHQTAEQFEKQCRSTPLQRGAAPEEIASAVRFILDAPSMTGQMLMLDGGQHLSWKKTNSGT